MRKETWRGPHWARPGAHAGPARLQPPRGLLELKKRNAKCVIKSYGKNEMVSDQL